MEKFRASKNTITRIALQMTREHKIDYVEGYKHLTFLFDKQLPQQTNDHLRNLDVKHLINIKKQIQAIHPNNRTKIQQNIFQRINNELYLSLWNDIMNQEQEEEYENIMSKYELKELGRYGSFELKNNEIYQMELSDIFNILKTANRSELFDLLARYVFITLHENKQIAITFSQEQKCPVCGGFGCGVCCCDECEMLFADKFGDDVINPNHEFYYAQNAIEQILN